MPNPLPTVGADVDTWGTKLNAYLTKAVYGPVINVADYGAIGDDSTDNSTAIQAALDAAGADKIVFVPPGIYRFNTTLKMNQAQHFKGQGFGDSQGTAPTANCTWLRFYGGSTANAIEMKTPDLSMVKIEGFRLTDDRTTPTSGSGIHLYRAKNNVVIRDCHILKWKTNAISIVADTDHSTDTECINIENCWVQSNGTGYGIYILDASNNVTIKHIMSDGVTGDGSSQAAVIYLDWSLNGGCTVNIIGVKLETNQGCHMVVCGAGFRGNLNIMGLVMRGPTANGGGDMLRLEGTGEQRAINCGAMSSVDFSGGNKVCTNFVNDVGRSITYTNTASRSMPGFIQGGVDDSTHYAQQMVIAGTGLNVAGALTIKTKAGAISDADYIMPPPNGTIAFDTTNFKFYVRAGGVWKVSAALT